MELVNLTPHPVKILDGNGEVIFEAEGCGKPPRAKEVREEIDIVRGIPVNRVYHGGVEGLPEPDGETGYIVSRIIAEACPRRTDLYVPDETVRDEQGRIIGCRALAEVV